MGCLADTRLAGKGLSIVISIVFAKMLSRAFLSEFELIWVNAVTQSCCCCNGKQATSVGSPLLLHVDILDLYFLSLVEHQVGNYALQGGIQP